jgi:hypothetical protein
MPAPWNAATIAANSCVGPPGDLSEAWRRSGAKKASVEYPQ